MTKDYAEKHSIRTTHNRGIAMLPSWTWVLFGLLIGGGVSGFFFWKLVSTHPVEEAPVPTITITSVNEQSAQRTSTDKIEDSDNLVDNDDPRFDFYTLLPNLTVEVPDIAAPKQIEISEALAPERLTPEAYIIQVGSFRQEDQANELKIQLILQGQEAKLQTVKINSTDIWYRVYIGPFVEKIDALAIQQNLMTPESVNSLILKIRV